MDKPIVCPALHVRHNYVCSGKGSDRQSLVLIILPVILINYAVTIMLAYAVSDPIIEFLCNYIGTNITMATDVA